MGTNDKDSVVSLLGAALVQMHGCGDYTPKDVDELEEAAWKALKLLEEQEIVRCKDCKYWRQNTQICRLWSVGYVAHHTPPDWYCADGERR